MNYNNKQDKKRWKIVLVALLCIVAVGLTVILKTSTRETKNLHAVGEPDSTELKVAIPDTSADSTLLPSSTDSVYTALPDTLLGRDKRNPYEGGYEDGYAAGCDDGAANAKNASYDEECSYAKTADRERYVKGYREGYAKGYDDGQHGKQFNIGDE